ncbi:MAG TPA: IS1182 family transposase [Pseudogulbenkiania sp.]|nr:IS1182 family transposase [Pseudogulbenkiania sp.]
MHYQRGQSRSQVSFFPEALDELLPIDHPVRVIDLFVEQLDLTALGFSKVKLAAKGRPPYHPADLLKLYLYGYLNRVRSSRRLEAECQRNIEVMWLLNRLAPDHKTIANFRKDQGKGIQAVCRAFVQFCRKAKLISGALVAIDGSKFQAVASPSKAVSIKQLEQQQTQLDDRIARYLTELDQADQAEGEVLDRQRVEAALQQLRSMQDDLATRILLLEEMGLNQHVEGEPEAQLMRDGQKRIVPAYNVQSVVDEKHKLIVHHEVVNETSDQNQLLPMATASKAVLEQDQLTVVADAGYSNGEHLTGCEGADITTYVALNRGVNNQGDGTLFDRSLFRYDAQQDCYHCPADQLLVRKQINRSKRVVVYQGIACGACPIKSQCTQAEQRQIRRHFDEEAFARTQSRLEANPEIMRQRKAIVEHPFGNLKRWIMGDGRFLLRGLQGAQTESALAILSYNLRRVLNILGVAQTRRLLMT